MKHVNLFTKALVASILLISISTLTHAQQEERSISGIDEISYSLPGTLIIKQGSAEKLILKGDAEDLQKIITEIDGDELRIYVKRGNYNLGDVEVHVTVKTLEEIGVAGSGDVVVKSPFETGELDINLSGSGDIVVESITSDEIELNLSGSGNIEIAGFAKSELELNLAGSGNIDASDLQTSEAEINIAGSGNAKVWAEEELEVSIVGSGNCYYKGNPVVDSSTSGSGSTKPM